MLVNGPDTNFALLITKVLKKDCVRYPSSFSNDLQYSINFDI